MQKVLKYDFTPGVLGAIASFLLIVSFFLPRIFPGNKGIEAINTVLIVAIMCMCVHLIRRTAAIYHRHVWNSAALVILLLIPAFNLVVTAVQFVSVNLTFMTSLPFTAVLIVFSLPAFFCYYFIYVARKFNNDIRIKIIAAVMTCAAAIYAAMRFSDKIFIPLAVENGVSIPRLVSLIAPKSSSMSLVMYILSACCFIAFGVVSYEKIKYGEKDREKE